MSEQTLRRVERIADLRAAMPWLVAAGIYVLVIAVAPQLLGDPDTYSHLALGRWILDHGAVPTVDPLKYQQTAPLATAARSDFLERTIFPPLTVWRDQAPRADRRLCGTLAPWDRPRAHAAATIVTVAKL